MKRGILFGSFCCIIVGIVALLIAVFWGGNAWSMAIVILAYFMGVPLVFTKFTDAETTEKLVTAVIVVRHGPRYWTLLTVALIVSIYLAYQFVVLTQRTPFSGIHFGLGLAAVLSAFITPSYTDTSFPENDIFG